MRFLKLLAAAAMLLVASVPFVANASPVLNNDSGGNGFVTGTPTNFSLVGSDNGSGFNTTSYTDTVASTGNYTFDWSYTTTDCCGSYWDPAGYVLNGSNTQLSTDFNCNSNPTCVGQINSSGVLSIALNAGDIFGWYVLTKDGFGGTAEISVSAVPEPVTLSLFGAGLAGAVAMRRRKRKAA